jgi:hypothetical protein
MYEAVSRCTVPNTIATGIAISQQSCEPGQGLKENGRQTLQFQCEILSRANRGMGVASAIEFVTGRNTHSAGFVAHKIKANVWVRSGIQYDAGDKVLPQYRTR